ncbi:PEGA domain-containing protein [Deinococcus yavapaiensis]|uniref:PEGA domain-containing protein n=1 Tax=Deinococcus yavapaiensis KR-236 TaxID=694435 RepID=A0A318SF00_9DEIO|nr:PEGA domain-containing protein [Deinococcus yavapaiensis]PYE55805.1 PEGA domain-containing protein [Deinococcus yavapaiensis KR-236]
MKKILALGTMALATAALAQPRISAQSIIVNPTPTDLSVRVWTDKDPSGQSTPNYAIGERIRLFVTTNQDAYVYLFNVGVNGEIDQILPNRYSGDNNLVRAGETRQFPRANNPQYSLDVAGPAGVNRVLALASRTPLNLDQISQFRAEQTNQGFATVTVRGSENLAQALSIVVTPIPQNTWTTDTASYNVVAPQAPARTGSITVNTNVPGATVYINDREVGDSGSTFPNLAAGTYRVRISAPGYTDINQTVTVRAGVTVNVNVTLQAQRATLTIRSNVNGARVFVNGQEQGVIRNGALTLTLNRDDYQIVLVAPGYAAGVSQVQVVNGGTITVNLNRLQ